MPKLNHSVKKVPLKIKETESTQNVASQRPKKAKDPRDLTRTVMVKSAAEIKMAKPEMTLNGF